MLIEIPRGDYKQVYLTLNVTEEEVLDLAENEDLILTIKESYYSPKFVIQKSVYEGTIVKHINEQGQISYVFDLNPEDTLKLKYEKYVGDLKIVRNIDTNYEPETLELVELNILQEATNMSTDYKTRYEDFETEKPEENENEEVNTDGE